MGSVSAVAALIQLSIFLSSAKLALSTCPVELGRCLKTCLLPVEGKEDVSYVAPLLFRSKEYKGESVRVTHVQSGDKIVKSTLIPVMMGRRVVKIPPLAIKTRASILLMYFFIGGNGENVPCSSRVHPLHACSRILHHRPKAHGKVPPKRGSPGKKTSMRRSWKVHFA